MNKPKSEKNNLIQILLQKANQRLSKEQIKALIEENNIDLNERNIGELVVFMVSTFRADTRGIKSGNDKGTNIEQYEWDYKDIMLAIKDLKRTLNWIDIYRQFDTSKLRLNSMDSFYLVIDIWAVINGINTFPFTLFFEKWKSEKTQHDFVFYLIESNPQRTQLHSNIFLTKIVSSDEIKKERNSIDSSDSAHEGNISPMQPFSVQTKRFIGLKSSETVFNSVELFKCISFLNSRLLIDKLTLIAPEWSLLGLPYILPQFEDIFERLMHDLLKSEKHGSLLYIVFKNHPLVLLNYLSRMIKYNISLSRMLDVVLELKILSFVSDTLNPPYFCFELLILSSRRDHLNIHFWIGNSYNHKRDKFINLFIWYLKEKIKDAKSKVAYNKQIYPHSDSVELLSKNFFPLTFEIFTSLIKTLELLHPKFSSDTIKAFNELKEIIPVELSALTHKKPALEDKTNEFITKFINGTSSVSESIIELQGLLNGNIYERELGNKVLLYLVENYNNFHKLSDWENMAIFYGKLIDGKIFTHAFINKAQNNVFILLKNSKDNQQVYFALKCLENFYGYLKKERKPVLDDLEKIKTIKDCLIDYSQQQISDVSYNTGISIKSLLDEIFFENKAFKYSEDTEEALSTRMAEIDIDVYDCVREVLSNLRPENFEISIAKFNSLNAFELSFKYFIEHKIHESKNYVMYADLIYKVDNNFISYFLNKSFLLLKSMLNYNVERKVEAQFAQSLGTFLGILTIARDKIFTVETFNVKEFIMLCIEKRRIVLCVLFTVNFLIEGKKSKIFVPNNPWLMKIIEILNEIYDINADARDEISRIHQIFNVRKKAGVKLSENGINRHFYLASYILDSQDLVLKHIICLAIDFSVREICQAIIERTCSIAIKTTIDFSHYLRVHPDDEKCSMRNIMLNLSKALTLVSSRVPTRSSIISNITYFSKQATLELDTESIYKIADDNLDICCDMIERTALSKMDDVFEEFFKDYLEKKHIIHGKRKGFVIKDYNKPKNETLPIIFSTTKYLRMDLKNITPNEANEVKISLKNISKKIPNKNLCIINKEWEDLVKHIDSDHFIFEFERILKIIESSNERDVLCENLCQCLIGHILRTSSHRDLLFALINKVFYLSFKTAQHVINWVIYGEDERKMNPDVIKGFIRHGLINTTEFDQYIARNLKRSYKNGEHGEKILKFALNIMTRFVLGDIKICTPFEFIFTIETLSKMNEEKYDERIYETLKKISDMMMPMEFFYEHKGVRYGSYDGMGIFDDSLQRKYYAQLCYYRKLEKYNKLIDGTIYDDDDRNETLLSVNPASHRIRAPSDGTREDFESRQPDDVVLNDVVFKDFNVPLEEPEIIHILLAGIHVSWDHYIRFFKLPSTYCYFNIEHCLDCVTTIEHFYLGLKIFTYFMIEGYHRSNYLILRVYTYFILESIKKIERSFSDQRTMKPYKYFIPTENDNEFIYCIVAILKIISPSKLPVFVVHFLEIYQSNYLLRKIVFQEDMFFIFAEVLTCLNLNDRLILHVTRFFMRIEEFDREFLKRHSSYFSFLTNNKYAYLKNFFNNMQDVLNDQNNEILSFRTFKECYFSLIDYLKGEISERIVMKINELDDNQKRWVLCALVDSLGNKNKISYNSLSILRMMVNKGIKVNKIRDLCVYRNVKNAPIMLRQAIEEFGFDTSRGGVNENKI